MARSSGENRRVKQGDDIVDLTATSTPDYKKKNSSKTTAALIASARPSQLTLKEGDNIVDLTTTAETFCGASVAQAPPESAIRGVYGLDFANYSFWGTPEHAVSEFPITKFKEWYKDLRFAKFLSFNPYVHEENKKWLLKVITIDPLIQIKETRDKEHLEWAQSIATAFYQDIFLPNDKDYQSIHYAVRNNKTVMVVVICSNENVKDAPAFVGSDPKTLTVIAAVTFKEGNALTTVRPALILWIGVQDSRRGNCDAPLCMSRLWRRQGFGFFLLIHVIKRCIYYNIEAGQFRYVTQEYPTPVDIYLQCTTSYAYHFYLSAGFIHVNNTHSDGWDILPTCLQDALKDSPQSFIKYVPTDGHPPCKLMHLRPGYLQLPTYKRTLAWQLQKEEKQILTEMKEMKEKTNTEVLAQKSFIWCRYPSASAGLYEKVVCRAEHLEVALTDLPLIQNLLPPPYNRLLPASSFRFGGDIMSDRRLLHSESKGTEWMQSNEMNMMIAFLLRDSRYDEYASILPVDLGKAIREGYEYHRDAKWALEAKARMKRKYMKRGEEMPENEYEAYILRVKSKSLTDIMDEYEKSMNYILEKYVATNPGLLSKRFIAIPYCMNNNHWVVTFVFNAMNVNEDLTKRRGETDSTFNFGENCARPCFFHYCPQSRQHHPSHDWGVVWFLNLAYSYRKMKSNEDGTNPKSLKWVHPFGKVHQDEESLASWKGSESLPILRFPSRQILPIQIPTDGWNCGFGVVATIGIFLRDIVGNFGNEDRYLAMFREDQLPIKYCARHEEYYCKLPKRAISRVSGDTPREDYLSRLRQQWFILFDRMAELQNVTIPDALNVPGLQASRQYILTRGLIRWPQDLFCSQNKVPRRKESENELAAAATIMALAEAHPPVVREILDARHPGFNHWVANQIQRQASAEAAGPPAPASEEEKMKSRLANKKALLKASAEGRSPTKNTKAVPDLPASVVEEVDDAPKKIVRTRSSRDKNNETSNPTTADKAPPPQSPPSPPNVSEEDGEQMTSETLIRTPTSKTDDRSSTSRRSERLKNHNPVYTFHPKRKDSESKRIVLRSKKRIKSEMVANDTFIWEEEREKRLMSWWKEDIDNLKAKQQSSKQAKKSNDEGNSEDHQDQLTIASLKAFVNYRSSLPSTEQELRNAPIPVRNGEEVEEFIQRSFEAWGWYSEEDYIATLRHFRHKSMKAVAKKDSYTRRYFSALHRLMKKERLYYRRVLEAEYLCSVPAVLESVKYRRDSDTFIGRMVFEVPDPDNPGKTKPDFLEEALQEEWVRRSFSPEMVQHIINLDSGLQWTPVPPSQEPVRVHNKPIVRVRWRPPYKIRVPITTSQSKKTTTDAISKEERIVPGVWFAKLADSDVKECTVPEEFLVEKFGKVYVDEVKKLRRGFVDVPVGDYKPSSLQNYPHLRVSGAPILQYRQSAGQNLCVSKSFASALFAIGFAEEAKILNAFGEDNLAGNVTNALIQIQKKAISVLPRWLQPRKMPLKFDWQDDLDDSTILLAVLTASDGHRNHAITIHGGFIYDANEEVALPLNQEALDYCVSTEVQKSTFENFRRGVLFSYMGTKELRKGRMMPIHKT